MQGSREWGGEHLNECRKLFKPHPNPLLSKEREHKSCFPLYQGGTKGGRFRVYLQNRDAPSGEWGDEGEELITNDK
jgi:hypothetical protein